jgi:NADH-quinone oxidoreductase subunit M
MFQRVFLGTITHDENATLPDLRPREWASVVPLCALAIFMGVFPSLFLAPMELSVRKVVERVQTAQPVRADRERQDAQGKRLTASKATEPDAARTSVAGQ